MSESVIYALLGAIIGNTIVATWAAWPVIVDVRWHGLDNHLCNRKGCCR